VIRYDPWYGSYYQYCYAVPEGDWEHRQCGERQLQSGHNGACTYNSDLPDRRRSASSGKCRESPTLPGVEANGSGGADADGGFGCPARRPTQWTSRFRHGRAGGRDDGPQAGS